MRSDRRVLALLAVLLVGSAWGEAPEKRVLSAAEPELHGQLSEYGGLRVLEVWGDDGQAGYAHGYLLAAEIRDLFDDYLLHPDILGPEVAVWDQKVLPTVGRVFAWSAEAEAELAAVLRGMTAALGADGLRSARLGRTLTLEDLRAANAYADLWTFMCSSVSVWGGLTADGETLTGRNLDFPYTTPMAGAQVLYVRHASGGQPGYASVTWPGMIGVYTAMSERGVTILMHDANGLERSQPSGYTPRSLILREALLAARPETFVADVGRVFRARRVLVGNNIHVSTGRAAAGEAPPAVVFEYDANGRGEGVTVREPAAAGAGPGTAVWCTNHMCARRTPQACERFSGLTEQVSRHTEREQVISAERLFEIMHAVRQPITLHTVVLAPARLELKVRAPAITGDAWVAFDLREWFTGALAAAGSGARQIGR